MWTCKNAQKPLVFLFVFCLLPLGAKAQSKANGTMHCVAGDSIIGETMYIQGSHAGLSSHTIRTNLFNNFAY